MITESILFCPHCEHKETEELYENISPYKCNCKNCKLTISITKGECCIYCKYGDVPCINSQIIGSSCCTG